MSSPPIAQKKIFLKSSTEDRSNCLTVLDANRWRKYVINTKSITIVHLAAILSAVGRRDKAATRVQRQPWNGLYNVLEVAREIRHASLYAELHRSFRSFHTARITRLKTRSNVRTRIYGVTKVAGELLCDYYYTRFRCRYARRTYSRV